MSTKITKKNVHIMESVDILDRVDIILFQPVPGHFTVDFSCKEFGKQLVVDTDMLREMERKIVELCRERQLSVSSQEIDKTRGFIQEYIGRFIQKCHKLNLAVIEDVPKGTDDHYAKLRKLKPVSN